jgi:hypothetical protein
LISQAEKRRTEFRGGNIMPREKDKKRKKTRGTKKVRKANEETAPKQNQQIE